MRKSVLLLVVLCIWLKVFVYGEDPAGAGTKKNKDGAISILKFIPGIPQLKAGKTFKGTLLLGSFLGTITGAFLYNHRGNQWYEKYQHSTDVADIILWRRHTEKSFKNRNLCLVGVFSLWLFHILDLKLFKSEKAGITGDVGKNKMEIGFYYGF